MSKAVLPGGCAAFLLLFSAVNCLLVYVLRFFCYKLAFRQLFRDKLLSF